MRSDAVMKMNVERGSGGEGDGTTVDVSHERALYMRCLFECML